MAKKQKEEKKEVVVKRCLKIVEAFDSLEMMHCAVAKLSESDGIKHFTLGYVRDSLNRIYKYLEDLHDKGILDEKHFSEYENLTGEIEYLEVEIPLAFGYALGQMVDISYPEIQREVKELQKLLRGEKLLPYFPRERKTA
jgi:hypothetical protein